MTGGLSGIALKKTKRWRERGRLHTVGLQGKPELHGPREGRVSLGIPGEHREKRDLGRTQKGGGGEAGKHDPKGDGNPGGEYTPRMWGCRVLGRGRTG